MESVLGNAYIYWIITGAIGLMIGALGWFVKRQRDKDDRRMERIEQAQARDHEHLERTLRELPLTYTLREEFLRVTSLQTNKIDKVTDMLGEIGKGVAALTAREDKS